MAILKFRGTVSTNRVGSECSFEFGIDEEDLPEDPGERERKIDEIAFEDLMDSGQFNWSYEQVEE